MSNNYINDDDYDEHTNYEKEYLDAAKNGDLKTVERLHDDVRPHRPELQINSEGDWELPKPNYESKEEIQDAALQVSAENGHLEVTKYLVEQGTNIHADDDAALRNSAGDGHLSVVKYLVEQGANIHAKNDLALCLSAGFGHLEVAKYLVDQGSDPQKVIDCEESDKSVKEWAEKYINSRDMSNKLENELMQKPSFQDMLKKLGKQSAQQQGLTQSGKRKM
ncbi:ankyrin repeat domain-containing protein [Ralstonia insidiosa]|uniref:ankyrin repeat domain-containing protein n=1 Tax=Ralstonia insidiosa TaxID=190721 RepID=UPI0009EDBF9F|nr:ankyrin repeat domain-containing protein [Ralstonia insidiosa]